MALASTAAVVVFAWLIGGMKTSGGGSSCVFSSEVKSRASGEVTEKMLKSNTREGASFLVELRRWFAIFNYLQLRRPA